MPETDFADSRIFDAQDLRISASPEPILLRFSVYVKHKFAESRGKMWEIFEKLMKRDGLTISAAARLCGCSPSTLTDWRAGRYTPKVDKLQKFAEVFGVSLEYLQTGTESLDNALSAQEWELLRLYRSLTPEGRTEALERVGEMAAMDKWTKKRSERGLSASAG